MCSAYMGDRFNLRQYCQPVARASKGWDLGIQLLASSRSPTPKSVRPEVNVAIVSSGYCSPA
jgi:hypothetical protein